MLLLLAGGCAFPALRSGPHVVTAPPPSDAERYCAWYGDSDGEILYVGLSAFWSAMRAADGDPRADLREPGPQQVGRFDLARERWLPPLDVGPPGSRSGVWDVYLHGDGRLYFTSYFETSGRVDPVSGEVTRLDGAGLGLNELAPGPRGHVLVSRYGRGDGGKAGGELLTIDPDAPSGPPSESWPLPSPSGSYVAPKTPAWNPVFGRLVATTDLLPEFEGGEIQHPTYELDPGGDWRITQEPELQFVVALPDGTEYRAEAHADRRLWLRRLGKPGARIPDAAVLLDADFPAELDFVQDLKTAPGDRLVVTRWSGVVHVVSADGRVATSRLPRPDPRGLYYTAVIHGDRLCASYCADVTVVCVDAP